MTTTSAPIPCPSCGLFAHKGHMNTCTVESCGTCGIGGYPGLGPDALKPAGKNYRGHRVYHCETCRRIAEATKQEREARATAHTTLDRYLTELSIGAKHEHDNALNDHAGATERLNIARLSR